ncbi:MAG: DUF1476 domain-containing protein [Rhodobacteraceae bacterium]|nr:DUF1476 domain-containing protein [Paracoccaceae bacterium]
MTTFDDRESAYENKFAHDEEMNFKAQARCNKMLAIWAAGMMDKPENEVEDYIREVINSDFKEAGHEDVVSKVAADLGETSDIDTVRTKRAGFLAEVKVQLMDEI